MSALRSLAFLTLISCGMATAAWSGLRVPSTTPAEVHLISKPAARSGVVWIDTAHN